MLGHLGIIAEAQINGVDRPRVGNDLYGAFGRDFPTSDGKRLMIVALTERQWRAVVEACGIAEPVAALERKLRLDFRKEGDRFHARDALNPLVAAWIARRPYAEVAAAFSATGALFERYQSFGELVANDPRCSRANPLFGEVDLELRSLGLIPHHLHHINRRTILPAFSAENPNSAMNQMLFADVIYVRDFTKANLMDDEQLKHLALVAHHCYCSHDLAIHCLYRLAARNAIAPNAVDLFAASLKAAVIPAN